MVKITMQYFLGGGNMKTERISEITKNISNFYEQINERTSWA